jgi:hypothetical protein
MKAKFSPRLYLQFGVFITGICLDFVKFDDYPDRVRYLSAQE